MVTEKKKEKETQVKSIKVKTDLKLSDFVHLVERAFLRLAMELAHSEMSFTALREASRDEVSSSCLVAQFNYVGINRSSKLLTIPFW